MSTCPKMVLHSKVIFPIEANSHGLLELMSEYLAEISWTDFCNLSKR